MDFLAGDDEAEIAPRFFGDDLADLDFSQTLKNGLRRGGEEAARGDWGQDPDAPAPEIAGGAEAALARLNSEVQRRSPYSRLPKPQAQPQ